ncbi:anomalous homeobox protein [Grus japonensis]|uniref:Anomalous homeobox protein n=1 Tax=Grus japonensis TaxID=30415 RepID=A0ABC9XJT8_GRUJA
MWQGPSSTRGVSGSAWTPGIEVPVRLCLASLSAHLFLHPAWKKAKPWDKARSSSLIAKFTLDLDRFLYEIPNKIRGATIMAEDLKH